VIVSKVASGLEARRAPHSVSSSWHGLTRAVGDAERARFFVHSYVLYLKLSAIAVLWGSYAVVC
jgi:hypothetical protein